MLLSQEKSAGALLNLSSKIEDLLAGEIKLAPRDLLCKYRRLGML